MSDWERLGHLVRERRDALGLSQGELGPSAATWRNVEHAINPPFRRKTLLALERALNWMPNSIDRILEGGEPELAEPEWDAEARTYGPDVSLEEKLADINRRLARVERFLPAPDEEVDIPERYRDLLADLRADGRDDEADALVEYWRERRGPPPAEQAS